MSWPKKHTRKIVVDGQAFLWHYSGHCPWCSTAVITVGNSGDRYFLFIDPYPFEFQFLPASIADAIRWAVTEGWTSARGPTRAMSFDRDRGENLWLPEGARHL